MKPGLLFACIGIVATLLRPVQAQVTVDVHIYDFDFGTAGHVASDPTINVGDTVHWIWDTTTPHSTTSAAGQAESWNSGIFSTPGTTFDHTFTQVGTFNYYCLVHGLDLGNGNVSLMSGSITVVPEPGAWSAAVGLLLAGFVLYRARTSKGTNGSATVSPVRR
jgi:plastocyanin